MQLWSRAGEFELRKMRIPAPPRYELRLLSTEDQLIFLQETASHRTI